MSKNTYLDPERKHVPFLEKVTYSEGWMVQGILSVAAMSYLTIYYNTVFGVDLMKLAAAMTIGRVLDAFSDPLMAWISDSIRSKWGRRKPFIAIGGVMWALTMYFTICPPEFIQQTENRLLIYIAWMMVLDTTFLTMLLVPYKALGADITPNADERVSVAAMRTWFACGGKMLGPIIIKPMVSGTRFETAYPTSIMIIGAVMAVFILLPAIFCRERITGAKRKEGDAPFYAAWSQIFGRPRQIFYFFGAFAVLGALVFAWRTFLQVSDNDTELLTTINLVLLAVVSIVALRYLAQFLIEVTRKGDSSLFLLFAGIMLTLVAMVAMFWYVTPICKALFAGKKGLAIAWILLCGAFAIGMFTIAFVREGKKKAVPGLENWVLIFSNWPFICVSIAFLLMTFGLFTSSAMLVYISQFQLGGREAFSDIFALVFGVPLIAIPLWKLLSTRIGLKRCFLMVCVLMMACFIGSIWMLKPAHPNHWRFEQSDILDWSAFGKRVVSQSDSPSPNPGKRLWEVFPEDTRAFLADATVVEELIEDKKNHIIASLNEALRKTDLYDEESFKGVKLSKNIKNFWDLNKEKMVEPTDEIEKFNRIAIQTAYPKLMVQSPLSGEPWELFDFDLPIPGLGLLRSHTGPKSLSRPEITDYPALCSQLSAARDSEADAPLNRIWQTALGEATIDRAFQGAAARLRLEERQRRNVSKAFHNRLDGQNLRDRKQVEQAVGFAVKTIGLQRYRWRHLETEILFTLDSEEFFAVDAKEWSEIEKLAQQEELTSIDKATIAAAFSVILNSPDFYDPDVFAGVTLPEESQALLKIDRNDLTKKQTRELNFALLEATFPNEIQRSHSMVMNLRFHWAFLFGGLTLLWIVLLGIGNGGLSMLTPAILPDVVDYDTLRTGQKRAGIFFAVESFAVKISGAPCQILGAWFIAMSGVIGANPKLSKAVDYIPPPGSVDKLRWFYLVLPAVMCAAAFIAFVFYPITPKRSLEIRKQLAEMEAKERDEERSAKDEE